MAPARGDPHRLPTGTPPARRRLRVFSLDPTASRRTGTASVLAVPWEPLRPGPRGSRIAVIDYLPDGSRIAPVDLEDAHLLAADGLTPDESDPQFHQQMVYAVLSKLLETLDIARGRRLVWRNIWRTSPDGPGARPLPVFPHRMRVANAFYAPGEGLSFGSFLAADDQEELFPGQWVHGCLSHDIVNHEAAHAFLHELRPLSLIPSGPDALAFQEGFADIVAILQHFTLPGLLESQIAQRGAPLWEPGPFVELAGEFGHGSGRHGAVRQALDDPSKRIAQSSLTEPHERGAVLVAALFEAFFAAYTQRIQLVLRIGGHTAATDARNLSQELVTVICRQAREAASMVLTMAVRAIDYLPAVDITFSAFLDAVIAADTDLFPEDRDGFRRSFVEACRRRGIYPSTLPGNVERTVPDYGRWEPLPTRQGLMLAAQDLAGVGLPQPVPLPRTAQLDRAWHLALLEWGRHNAGLLGLDPATLEVDGGNAGFRLNQDGFPTAVVTARFVQRNQEAAEGLPRAIADLPLIGGATVVAGGDGRLLHLVHSPVPGVGRDGAALLQRMVEEADPISLASLACLVVDRSEQAGGAGGSRERMPHPVLPRPRKRTSVPRRVRVGGPGAASPGE